MNRSFIIHGCGAAIALVCVSLSVFSFHVDASGTTRGVTLLLLLLGGASVFYIFAIWRMASGGSLPRLGVVLLWAVIFRLLLFPGKPILETDYYRYLWDGFVLSNGYNPYQFSPQEVLDDGPIAGLSTTEQRKLDRLRIVVRKNKAAHQILSEVNNPSVITIYPPFAQVVFGVAAKVYPLSLYGWRVMILFFDALLIMSLVILLPRFGRDPSWVLVYAWSPLVLKETVNTLHFDVIAMADLFLGVLFAVVGYGKRCGAAWACAALTKVHPVLSAPIWLIKQSIKSWLVCIGIIVGGVFLFSGVGERGASGLAAFANRWESNSSVVVVLEYVLGIIGIPQWGEGGELFTFTGVMFSFDSFLLAKALCAAFVAGLSLILIWKSFRNPEIDYNQQLNYTFYIVGAILICSPVCNPWYITWIVPFLCFCIRPSWLYLSISIFIYYTFFTLDPWDYLPYSRQIEYIPFFVLMIWEFRLLYCDKHKIEAS